MDALPQIDAVTKRYDGSGWSAVDGMTLEITPGEGIAVTGPSGSAKPTLPNLIADLDRPTDGTITAAGLRTRPSSPKRSASKVSLRAARDRLILDAYSVAARGEQIGGPAVTDRGQTNPHRAAEERHGANSLASLLPSRQPQAEVVRASAGHGARGGECHLGAHAERHDRRFVKQQVSSWTAEVSGRSMTPKHLHGIDKGE
jgi:ABC-type glutathione transport system ATPase component